jgi:hypothetical protein
MYINNIFAYLKAKHNARMVFDPRYLNSDYSKSKKRDSNSFYGDVKEQIPDNIPTLYGKEFIILCYCDSDHAEDKLTRRSPNYSGALNTNIQGMNSNRQEIQFVTSL